MLFTFDDDGNLLITAEGGGNLILGTTTPGTRVKIATPLDILGELFLNNVQGTAGQVLTSNGAAANPSWQNAIWTVGSTTHVDSPILLTTGHLQIQQADATHDGYVTAAAFNAWGAKYGSGDSPSFTTTTSTTFIGAYKSADETAGTTYDWIVGAVTAHFKNGIFVGLT
jgi:hypothetical protein